MPKFAICAEHFVKEGKMEAWVRLAKANAAASLKEKACHRFDVTVDRADPNHAILSEVYDSREAWLSHCQQPHFKTFVDGIQDLIEKRARYELDLLD
jgi:(4S)-4-hydroxy-5-phosphonooxypentane-2,3-dione isomerase